MLVVAAPHLTNPPISWRFFRTAGSIVLDGNVLTAYANHPDLQFGPLTFLVSAPFAALPHPIGSTFGMVFMSALGVASLCMLRSALPITTVRAVGCWWLGAGIASLAWAELAIRYGHLDDAIALTLIAAAVLAHRLGHPVVVALLLALSVDAKPWAVPLVAVVFLSPRRTWLPSLALWGAVVGACWAPFLVDTLHSMNAAAYVIPVDQASSLTLLPFTGSTTPWWCRSAQIGIGLALALSAVRYRSIGTALLATFGARLLLDPSVKAYYDIELLLAALACDLTLHRSRLPWITLLAAVTVYAPTYLLTPMPVLHAWIRTIGILLLFGVTLVILVHQAKEIATSSDKNSRSAAWSRP
ncbi:hypothetical protein [Humibacter sp.]|uniref:hypothetical protein n=1 Tax=Humibacter sp. TaxID=1940291 RepID=UPI003F7F8F60